jgi:hypothetical protein
VIERTVKRRVQTPLIGFLPLLAVPLIESSTKDWRRPLLAVPLIESSTKDWRRPLLAVPLIESSTKDWRRPLLAVPLIESSTKDWRRPRQWQAEPEMPTNQSTRILFDSSQLNQTVLRDTFHLHAFGNDLNWYRRTSISGTTFSGRKVSKRDKFPCYLT